MSTGKLISFRPLTDTQRITLMEPTHVRLLERVARRLTAILDLDTLLQEIVGDVAQTLGYSRSAVLLLDEDGNELVVVAARGWHNTLPGSRFKIGEPGLAAKAAMLQKTVYAPDVTRDPDYVVCEATSRSEVDIPLKSRGRLIGVFDAQHPEPKAFLPSDIQLLESVASYIAIAIENARAFERERLEKEKIQGELSAARVVQKSLTPKRRPTCAGFQVDGICDPCGAVGGDWYDFISLPNGKVGVVLADVAGKGAAAALLMASVRSILRCSARQNEQPAEALTQADAVLVKDLPQDRFVTMIYGVLDPQARTFTYSNAGHLPPILCESTGQGTLATHDKNGLPLGIARRTYEQNVVMMPPGRSILLFSDGVSEAAGAGGEEFGLERLCGSISAETSVESLLNELRAFRGSVPINDDVSMVLIRAS
jgi:sigma-B regulation protein RsbU (phosphoserine phosphatase)